MEGRVVELRGAEKNGETRRDGEVTITIITIITSIIVIIIIKTALSRRSCLLELPLPFFLPLRTSRTTW